MTILSNFTTEESVNITRVRNSYGFENMSTQQLKNKFTMLSASIPRPIPIIRHRRNPRNRTAIRFPPTPISRPSRTPEILPIDVDEPEIMEVAKTIPMP